MGAVFGFSKNGTYAGQPFTCGGQQCPKSITAVPGDNSTASVMYDLHGKASRLQGRVGIFSTRDAKPEQVPASPLVFELAANGKVLWRSSPMLKRDAIQFFRVELRGASTIELRTVCTGSGYCAWGTWLDVQVVQ